MTTCFPTLPLAWSIDSVRFRLNYVHSQPHRSGGLLQALTFPLLSLPPPARETFALEPPLDARWISLKGNHVFHLSVCQSAGGENLKRDGLNVIDRFDSERSELFSGQLPVQKSKTSSIWAVISLKPPRYFHTGCQSASTHTTSRYDYTKWMRSSCPTLRSKHELIARMPHPHTHHPRRPTASTFISVKEPCQSWSLLMSL